MCRSLRVGTAMVLTIAIFRSSMSRAELERRFEADGFVVARQSIPHTLIKALRASLEESHEQSFVCGDELTDTRLWDRVPVAKTIAQLPFLVSTARRLLCCSQIRLWQDQLIVKRANAGSATLMHRDAPYWPMETASAVTCWIPLQNVSEANGAMFFAPGSHRQSGLYSMLPLTELMAEPTGENDRSLTLPALKCVPLALGDCTFHNGLVVHGAYANLSPRPRLAYKLVYLADGTRFRFQWHGATAGLELKDGDLIAGPAFPLLV